MKSLKKEPTEFSKKLELEKEEIAALTAIELNSLHGGEDTIIKCDTALSKCCGGVYTVEQMYGCDL